MNRTKDTEVMLSIMIEADFITAVIVAVSFRVPLKTFDF